MKIPGSVAIVTGASSGIGLATAKLLTARGASVALVSRSVSLLKAIAAGLPGSLAVPADMSDKQGIIAMVKRVRQYYGRVDILVNSAGRGYDAYVEHIDLKKFRRLIDLNLLGPLTAMQQVIPLMRALGGGAIVNISSGTFLMSLPGMSPYSGLKRALNGISLAAAQELTADHITVSVVYPYITATDFEKNTLRDFEYPRNADEENDLPPADSAEYVAKKIIRAITSGAPEVFAHDWQKHR